MAGRGPAHSEDRYEAPAFADAVVT